MLRRAQGTVRPVRLGLTAAGAELELTSDSALKMVRDRPMQWQREAYELYDQIGEAWFAGQYIGGAMSRLRIFPAVQPADPEADPIAITSDKLEGEDLPTDEEIQVLLAASERLTNSFGGIGDILRGFGLNNFLGGESFLIGRIVDDQEEWDVHSILAMQIDADGRAVALQEYPDQKKSDFTKLWYGENDPQNAMVVHLWKRHPAWPMLPDSPMRPGKEYLEDLLTLTYSIRASARSRIPAGILGIPSDGSDRPIEPTDENAEGEAAKDPLIEQILKHFSTPIKNPRDAAALVPFILNLPAEELDKVKQFSFSRDIDKLAVELRRESRESFATTVDLPADVISGKQDLNHWTAWNIDEDSFKIHLASHAELIVDGLTAGYLWPSITGGEGLGFEKPRRFRLWYDATELTSHPNKFNNAKDLHDRIAISTGSLRQAGGFDEDDAPDEEEIAERVALSQSGLGIGAKGTPGAPVDGASVTPAPPVAVAAAPVALVASVPLGRRLAELEAALVQRLLARADSELGGVLRRVGNRVVTASQRRGSPSVENIVRTSATSDVPRKLGPELVASLIAAPDPIPAHVALSLVTETAFDGLRATFLSSVEQTQREGIKALQRTGHKIEREARAALDARMAADREAAWPLLSQALVQRASNLVFSVVASAPAGEIDVNARVNARSLRAALKQAGGGSRLGHPIQSFGSSAQEELAGVLSGQTFVDAYVQAGIVTGNYVWVYGDPGARTTSFQPHEDLDGETFASWEDDLLLNDESWPNTEFFYPDDHDGCQCTFALDAGES